MYVYIYICVFIHVCVCMYIYIYMLVFWRVPILAEVHIERGSTSSRGTCRLSSTSCASSLIVPEQRIHPQRSERSRFCRFNMAEWYLMDVYSLNLAFKGVTYLVWLLCIKNGQKNIKWHLAGGSLGMWKWGSPCCCGLIHLVVPQWAKLVSNSNIYIYRVYGTYMYSNPI